MLVSGKPPAPPPPPWDAPWPDVCAVIPARNEAEILPATLSTVLRMEYPGRFRVILIDDGSSDGTAEVACKTARDLGREERLTVLFSPPLPPGWTGKLWAMEQGVRAAARTEFILFTDADIAYPEGKLKELVARAAGGDLDLVSHMVRLWVETRWERLLIPPFVYFFALPYPFRRVCDPRRSTAAAAGGCLLVRREALERSEGLGTISGELIDDCALARRVKKEGRPGGGRIWLGPARETRSLRPYGTLGEIWTMVARTAFVQLRFSLPLLTLTVAGMLLVFIVPPAAFFLGIGGVIAGKGLPALFLTGSGVAAWGIMARTYRPTLRLYDLSGPNSFLLPLAAFFYTLMTVDSARRFLSGRGGAWKGRTSPPRREAQKSPG